MADSYQQARAELISTGTTSLQPSTAAVTVLRAMVGVLACVAVIGVVAIGALTDVPIGGALAGLVPLLAMLGGMWFWLGRQRGDEKRPLVVSPAGLTVKGVGPVPWIHLLPPEVQWQRAEHDSSYRRLPVMPFNGPGFAYLQSHLPPAQRRRLCGRKPLWGAEPAVIRLPPVRGVGRDELIALLAEAHAHFIQLR